MSHAFSADQLVKRLERVRKHFPASTSARLQQAIRVMRQASSKVQTGELVEGEPEIQEFSIAMQDGSLIADSFDVLLNPPPVPDAKTHLGVALEGSFLVPDPARNDHGRDVLWELFLATCLRRGGYEPLLAEPDVVTVVDGIRLGVAAKRLRSENFIKRIMKAVEQIVRQVHDSRIDCGSVALDISFALDQHAQLGIWRIPSLAQKDELRSQLRATLCSKTIEAGKLIQELEGADYIVGVSTFITPVIFLEDTRRINLVRYFFNAALDPSSHKPKTFLHAYDKVVRTCFSDN